jgi:hypothetical protein
VEEEEEEEGEEEEEEWNWADKSTHLPAAKIQGRRGETELTGKGRQTDPTRHANVVVSRRGSYVFKHNLLRHSSKALNVIMRKPTPRMKRGSEGFKESREI